MDDALRRSLEQLLRYAYPEQWSTAWLSLPLEADGDPLSYSFHVMCSDLPEVRAGRSSWPPTAREPHLWVNWPSSETGLWIGPKKHDPLLRERFILVEPSAFDPSSATSTISANSLLLACEFAAASGLMVWHNSPKGGASSPRSAHYQAMATHWDDGGVRRHTFPCCDVPFDSAVSRKDRLEFSLLGTSGGTARYPALGLAVRGPVGEVAARAWDIIRSYDGAQASNLVIQPLPEAEVRMFVFPRKRKPCCLVTESLLSDDERSLMKNNRGGAWSEWPFAGVETGLLTQVVWGPVFNEMRAAPAKWGRTLLRVLRALTLSESDTDWLDFRRVLSRAFA
jgi:hypothetical protein